MLGPWLPKVIRSGLSCRLPTSPRCSAASIFAARSAAVGIHENRKIQLRQFDRARKGKKTSNDDWQSPSDLDRRIAKMKDGTTGLAYNAEHALDLETEIVVADDVKPADAADGKTVKDTVIDAQGNLNDSTKQECRVVEVVADKGYHKTETLA